MSSFQDKVLREISLIEEEKRHDKQSYMAYLVEQRLNKSVSNYCSDLVMRSEMLKTNNTIKVARKLIKVSKNV